MANENKEATYKYVELKTTGAARATLPIRLLHLHPKLAGENSGSTAASLVGHIKQREDDEKYEALSYCWGPPVVPEEAPYIYILESDRYSKLKIQPNLSSALTQLRNDDGVFRPLWIDAVCIDQDNNEEKSQQIPLMDLIFQEAERVCIWLGGKAGEDDKDVVNHIKEIIKLQEFERLIDPKYTDQWAALASLMGREWFNRRWVVQEIAYARQAMVYWGTESIEWKDLADAVALFGSKAPQIAELFRLQPKYNHRADHLGDVEALSANRLVQTIGKVFRKADNGRRIERLLSLEALISNLSAFNASRPHDIIYAVLSLAKDTITTATKPNLVPQHSHTSRRRASSTGLPASHSRGHSSSLDVNAIPALDEIRTDIAAASAQNGIVSPVQEASSNALYELIPHDFEDFLSYVAQNQVWSFEKKIVETALEKINTHAACIQDPFVWEDMKQCILAHDETGAVIGKRFWDKEALEWCKSGNRGRHALTIKLLQFERVSAIYAENFLRILQGRVKLKTFHVNYQKKFYEVCKDFINFTLQSSRSLDMLCRPWAPDKEELRDEDKEEANLPSWICPLSRSPFLPRPDGTFGRINADLLVGIPDSGATTYRTSLSTVPEPCFFGGEGARNLFVTGLIIDEIRETATEAVEGNIPASWLELGNWENTKIEPPESFWRTIVADRNENGQNPPSYYQRACQIAFAQRVKRGSLNTNQLINSKFSQVMNEYLKRVQAVVWMRKLIRTKLDDADAQTGPSFDFRVNGSHVDGSNVPAPKGRLGLVPNMARIGDKICMLRGCSVPVVMRMLPEDEAANDKKTEDRLSLLQSQATGTKWLKVVCKLIGECYVHGIMDGEVFKLREPQGLLDTIFEIK